MKRERKGKRNERKGGGSDERRDGRYEKESKRGGSERIAETESKIDDVVMMKEKMGQK